MRRPSGHKLAVAHDQIGVGDFVEVTAAARIDIVRSRKRRGTVIDFEMYEVVRLFSAEEVKVSTSYHNQS